MSWPIVSGIRKKEDRVEKGKESTVWRQQKRRQKSKGRILYKKKTEKKRILLKRPWEESGISKGSDNGKEIPEFGGVHVTMPV